MIVCLAVIHYTCTTYYTSYYPWKPESLDVTEINFNISAPKFADTLPTIGALILSKSYVERFSFESVASVGVSCMFWGVQFWCTNSCTLIMFNVCKHQLLDPGFFLMVCIGVGQVVLTGLPIIISLGVLGLRFMGPGCMAAWWHLLDIRQWDTMWMTWYEPGMEQACSPTCGPTCQSFSCLDIVFGWAGVTTLWDK